MDTLIEQFLAAGFLDWLALLTSLAYVWLAARDNNWCWLFAAVSTAVWAWQSFVVYQLVSDGFLQLFYFVMAGVGWWRWRWRKTEQDAASVARAEVLDDVLVPAREVPSIRRMTLTEHIVVLVGGLVAGWALYLFVSGLFVSVATLPDAITTVFSIATTFLLIGRRLENWLYWIVIDAAYVWIYGKSGALLFAVMMVLNIGMAVYGYRNWRRELLRTEPQ